MRLVIAFLFFTISLVALPNEQETMLYGNQIYDAFVLQSQGRTREAFNLFKIAYQRALALGENRERLFLLKELFIWYRKFGYSLGIMSEPAKCTGEELKSFRNSMRLNLHNSSTNSYQSEWGKNPIQSGKVRDAMLGFGELISAALLITVGSPPVKVFGATVAWDGFTRIWNACNGLYVDYECVALQRLKALEIDAKALPIR